MTKSKLSLKITTLNVRGLVSKLKRDKLCLWLKRHDIDITGIQETHCTKSKLISFKNSWRGLSLYDVTDSSHSRGVGILFHEKLDVQLDNFECYNDGRAIVANVRIGLKLFSVVNMYAPNQIGNRIKRF